MVCDSVPCGFATEAQRTQRILLTIRLIRRLWRWRALLRRPRHGWALLVWIPALRRPLRLIGTISLRWRASLFRASALRGHLLTLLLLPAEPLSLIRRLRSRSLLFRRCRTRLRTRHVLLRSLALHISVAFRISWSVVALPPIIAVLCVRRTRHGLPFVRTSRFSF